MNGNVSVQSSGGKKKRIAVTAGIVAGLTAFISSLPYLHQLGVYLDHKDQRSKSPSIVIYDKSTSTTYIGKVARVWNEKKVVRVREGKKRDPKGLCIEFPDKIFFQVNPKLQAPLEVKLLGKPYEEAKQAFEAKNWKVVSLQFNYLDGMRDSSSANIPGQSTPVFQACNR